MLQYGARCLPYYRFRHAEPTLFIQKYNQFSNEENSGYRIDLSRNFRSRNEVLTAANYIFRQLFDEEVGDIVYDEHQELIYGNKAYDDVPLQQPEAELLIIDQEDREDDDNEQDNIEQLEDLEKAQLEARAYAKKIKTWIGHNEEAPFEIMDKRTNTKRNVEYRDIVILLRSMTWAPTIMEEFKKQGIPVYAELSTGYFAAIEIQIMISLLKVIDNPRQDIPLASVLKSPIVQLDEDELASIRLMNKKDTYYDALIQYMRNGENVNLKEKLTHFYTHLKTWRKEARQGALSHLIWRIYQETGYYDFVGGIPGGRQRQANLRALYDRAKGYESTSFRGLFRFLRFIERMEEKGDDLGAAKALGEQEDVVRIMTIHKSKGLEFPLVIVGALNKQFNQQDLREKFLLHKDYGFATKYIDPEKRIMYPTLLYHAIKTEMHRELLAEEMRVLYVALTRAREKLVLVGTVNSFEKQKKKWISISNHTDWVLPNYFRLESMSYLDWVGASLTRHANGALLRLVDTNVRPLPMEITTDQSKWSIACIHHREYQTIDEQNRTKKADIETAIKKWVPIDLESDPLREEVQKRLDYAYPFQDAIHFRAKQTVTEMKRQHEIKDSYSDEAIIAPYRAPIKQRPRFMQKEKQLTKAEIGIAMHTVMQHIPLDSEWDEASLREFVAMLEAKEMLTREEGQAIHVQAILSFFATEIGQLLKNAEQVEREVPFSLTLKAGEVYPNWQDENEERIFLQGVIDCLIKVEDGWILLDYKTDQLTDQMTEVELRKKYQLQLDLYSKALEQIWNEPIVKKYVYYFDRTLLLSL